MNIPGRQEMSPLSVISNVPRSLAFGSTLHLVLARTDPALEVRAFVRHDGLRYLQPIVDWDRHDEVTLLPEAPGHYAVDLQWRDAAAGTGWVNVEFDVAQEVRNQPWPTRVKVARGTRLWAPSTREAQILSGSEASTVERIRRIVRPGDTVYDVGANVGLYASFFSRLTGPSGRVYAFEANPVCVYFLQANRAHNSLENVEILPIAVGDSPSSIGFTVNYRNLLVGMSDAAAAPGKSGHRFDAPAAALDQMIETHGLRPPDIVKIDIEGAEGAAIAGMREILARHRPILIIEIHGRRAAEATLDLPVWSGYTFEESVSGRSFREAARLRDWFPDACLQIVATPVERPRG